MMKSTQRTLRIRGLAASNMAIPSATPVNMVNETLMTSHLKDTQSAFRKRASENSAR